MKIIIISNGLLAHNGTLFFQWITLLTIKFL